MKKVITATVGAALISGALLGAGPANADVYYKNCSESPRRRGDTALLSAAREN